MRILIRAPRFLGDVLMTFPALDLLRSARPDATFVAIGEEPSRELFERRGDVEEFHPVLPRRPEVGRIERARSFARVFKTIRSQRFDLAILFKSSMRDALLIRAAGIPRVAGFIRQGNQRVLTAPVRAEPGRHYANNYAYVVSAVLEMELRELPALRLPAEPRRVFESGQTTVGLALGGPHKGPKQWPVEHARALARMLIDSGAGVVLLGDRHDTQTANAIAQDLPESVCRVLTGQTSVGESIDTIAGLDLVVAIDSFALHVACAVGTPTVLIVGRSPSPIERVLPRADDLWVLRPDKNLIRDEDLAASILPEAVFETCLRALPRALERHLA